uniref:Wings apart-like protein homolog n=1 Tax=Takifugu rubripes TaxID=31033 RepID=A0A674MWG1_TAKRU
MTSRFGKTYSRKGGEGTSKFDEVLATKRGTLSTKWGDTTYKAKVSSKRVGAPKSDSVLAGNKRPRTSGAGPEDPFGFDSDEESKPVSSRSGSKSSPAKPASAEPPQSHQGTEALLSLLTPSVFTGKSQKSSSSQNQHSYSWYQNASESDKKPLAQTTTLKTGSKADSSYDSWDVIMGLRPPSPSQEPRNPAPTLSWASAPPGAAMVGCERREKAPSPPQLESPGESEDLEPDFLVETSDYSQTTSSSSSASLGRNSNCRTYRRPNKQGSVKASDSGDPGAVIVTADSSIKSTGRGGGRGRTRDYTVLHPSSMSRCNVTIHERGVEEFSTDATPPSGSSATGWQRKKAEQNCSFKPAKSKDTKLDLFGFDDVDAQQGDNGGDHTEGGSSYKIKYFGFDDMSDSDGEDDDTGGSQQRRRKKKTHPSPPPPSLVFRLLIGNDAKMCEDLQLCCNSASSVTHVFPLPVFLIQSPTKAVYNARHWTLDSEDEPPPPHFSRPQVATLYTVVQHVKHFNDVVEFGENQEFTDDFEYLNTGLKCGQPLNTRCLSVISLATRCAMPGFRMHLRARGKVAQVFKTLNDAPQHPNLALCTASLMYILSRDRLNMDLDRSCLDLMIRLLELDQDRGGVASVECNLQFSAREIAKMKEKIRKLCDTVHNKHLDLENITTGHLAMETLLSLTSKRAGDWFKEELRLLGGLDHIVDKVKECVDNLSQEVDKEKLVSSLWGAERCLRVLESVTVHNSENQGYLIAYKDSSLIVSSAKALNRCEQMIQRYSRELNSDCTAVGKAVEDCMKAVIGVLLNLTHDNEWGSTKTGEQEDLIMTALNCVLKVPQLFPQERRFDIRVLGLGLLINLVEYSARNKYCLMETEMEGGQGPFNSTVLLSPQHPDLSSSGPLSAIAALVQLFLQREQAAILAEAQTDDLIKEAPKPALDQSGEWQETGGEIQWVAKDNNNDSGKDDALQHAGKHMEDSIVASYTALLLGCLCQGSPMNVTTVRENLPKGDFSIMTEMLKKFLNFMNLTCDIGTAGQKSVSRIIDYLEHC